MAYNFDGTPRVPYPKHAPGRVRAGGFGKFTGAGKVLARKIVLQGSGPFKRDGVQRLAGAGRYSMPWIPPLASLAKGTATYGGSRRRKIRGGNTALLEEVAKQLRGGRKRAAKLGIGKASRVHPDSYFGPKLTR